jgi:hypothetical protein
VKNKRVVLGLGLSSFMAVASWFYFQNPVSRNLGDEALLSIIKNDQKGFERFLAAGGSLGTKLNVEGDSYMVGELLVKYNRLGFVKYANSLKMKFEIDPVKAFDIHSLSVEQNNPEMLSLILGNQKIDKNFKHYGKKGWSLLHMASAECSYKVVSILSGAGMTWDLKAKDGSTPLTVAAQEGCLQALSYFKEQGADFKLNDGRGLNALAILRKQKDSALMAFAESFMEKRAPASVITTVVVAQAAPNFYNKRKIPKDSLADRAHLIEPEDRPEEANETDENSEFSD